LTFFVDNINPSNPNLRFYQILISFESIKLQKMSTLEVPISVEERILNRRALANLLLERKKLAKSEILEDSKNPKFQEIVSSLRAKNKMPK
jgi:hypothetical protein